MPQLFSSSEDLISDSPKDHTKQTDAVLFSRVAPEVMTNRGGRSRFLVDSPLQQTARKA